MGLQFRNPGVGGVLAVAIISRSTFRVVVAIKLPSTGQMNVFQIMFENDFE